LNYTLDGVAKTKKGGLVKAQARQGSGMQGKDGKESGASGIEADAVI
jgi:hypothetical protein